MSGIVVDDLNSGMRYAVSEINFDPKNHIKVRDLKINESVRTYMPKMAPNNKYNDLKELESEVAE